MVHKHECMSVCMLIRTATWDIVRQSHEKETKYCFKREGGMGKGRMEEVGFRNGHRGLRGTDRAGEILTLRAE